MAIALGGSPSNPTVASKPSTPSLSSISPADHAVQNANVSPSSSATKKPAPSTTQSSSSPSTKSTTQAPQNAVASTAPPKASSSSKTDSSNTSRSPSSTANQSSKATTSSSTSIKVSTNSTSSAAKSSAQSIASGAANVTASTTTTHTFVPQVMTSDTLPFTTSSDPSPTVALGNFTKSSGFFANHSEVGGVFFVVAFVALGLAVLAFFGLRRYCRRRDDGYTREPALPDLEPSSPGNEMHYRRASQMRALGDVLSAGASRPFSGRSIPSDDSHMLSRDTQSSTDSTDPMIPSRFPNQDGVADPSQGYAGGYMDQYRNEVLYPPGPKQHGDRSQVSMQSAVETSPSIYPPTLPSIADEEEGYWRQHGFERVSDSPEADVMRGKRAAQQQPTPPVSALGLSNTSEPATPQYSTSGESELVKGLDPRMEPTSVHQGSTAPIALPPRLHVHDGRYPVLGGWTPPYRRPQQGL